MRETPTRMEESGSRVQFRRAKEQREGGNMVMNPFVGWLDAMRSHV